HEPVELDLDDRAEATVGQTDRGAHDRRLGQRRVHHPLLAEVLLQPVGDAEYAAEPTDVLPQEHHLGVVLHRRSQAGVHRLGEAQLHDRTSSRWATSSGGTSAYT